MLQVVSSSLSSANHSSLVTHTAATATVSNYSVMEVNSLALHATSFSYNRSFISFQRQLSSHLTYFQLASPTTHR